MTYVKENGIQIVAQTLTGKIIPVVGSETGELGGDGGGGGEVDILESLQDGIYVTEFDFLPTLSATYEDVLDSNGDAVIWNNLCTPAEASCILNYIVKNELNTTSIRLRLVLYTGENATGFEYQAITGADYPTGTSGNVLRYFDEPSIINVGTTGFAKNYATGLQAQHFKSCKLQQKNVSGTDVTNLKKFYLVSKYKMERYIPA